MVHVRKNLSIIAMVTVILLGLSLVASAVPLAENSDRQMTVNKDTSETQLYELNSYRKYLSEHNGDTIAAVIPLNVLSPSASAGDIQVLENVDGKTGLLMPATSEEEYVEYSFEVTQAGFYPVHIGYYPYEGNGNMIEREVYIDGKIPFKEAGTIQLSRVWQDSERHKTDRSGNEVRASQIELHQWIDTWLEDSTGIYDEPLRFYFTQGAHTLRIRSINEPLLIGSLELGGAEVPPNYDQVLEQYNQEGYEKATTGSKVQAEDMLSKSQPTIYATGDRGSAALEPVEPDRLLNNIVSGSRFQNVGDWIRWEIEAPQSGLYYIAMKTRQNTKDGGYSSRRLLIDGKQPFAEAGDIRFYYQNDWKVNVLGQEKPFLFYLNEGTHTLELQVNLGAFSDIISRTNEVVSTLNKVYREILVITGPSPDQFRDYQFEQTIPDTLASLKICLAELNDILETVVESAGDNGSFTSEFRKLILDVEQIVEDPNKIPSKMSNFKTNIGSLADWVVTAQAQPIDMDYICLLAPDAPIPSANKNLFANLWFSIRLFLSSFSEDYNALEAGDANADRPTIRVWLGNSSIPGAVTGSGRDQATIMQELIRNQYDQEASASIKFQLVAAGSLMPSVLSGIGPDVSLQMGADEPVNYALRGAVADLKGMDGFDEVAARFDEAALLPYTFNGKVYALPETLTYTLMFYRKDILKEIDLAVPNTWKEVYSAIFCLQNKNLEFGMPVDMSGYLMFLFQNKTDIYTEEGDAVMFDTEKGIESFNTWTDFFYSYKSPVAYNLLNRFRTGEMPLGIADFTFYNQLSVFAPEIAGLWGVAPVPGTEDENGNIDHTVSCGGVGCVILEQSRYKQEAWDFLRWWTDADTQIKYAQELESVMGVAARYPTANREAFQSLSWSKQMASVLEEQRNNIRGVRQVPGSYILSRYVTFAFQAVVNEGEESGKQIIEYTRQINHELDRKRREFGLSGRKEEN